MNSQRQQHYILENPEAPIAVSNVQRSALMDYEDIKFINEDIQEVDKDHFQLDTEVQQAGLSRFNIDEHLEVQLRFEGLDETHILLDDHSPTDEHWSSGFSRQDNGALGLETSSSNIAFRSSGTDAFKTSSLLRHTNVWSEATSSESVQMLLNSIRQDEINMTTEANLFEGSDFGELIGSSHNQMEINVWGGSKSLKRDSSPLKLQDVPEVEFETMDEKNHPGFDESAMDATEHNGQSPITWNDSEDNGAQHGSSALVVNSFPVMDCRLEGNKHIAVIGDPSEGNKLEEDISKLVGTSLQHRDAVQHLNVEIKRDRKEIAGCRFKVVEQMKDEMMPNCIAAQDTEEMVSNDLTEAGDKIEGKISEFPTTRDRLDSEGREFAPIAQSCCEVNAYFGQAEIQSMPDSLLEESNENSPDKHVAETSPEDIGPAGIQGSSDAFLDESGDNNAWRLSTEASQDDVMFVELQGAANPVTDDRKEDAGIGSNWTKVRDEREEQVTLFPKSKGRFNNEVREYATLAGSSHIGSAGFGQAEIQGMSGSALSEHNGVIVEKNVTEVSRDDAEKELKGIPELLLDESNEKRVEGAYDGVELNVKAESMLDEGSLKNALRHAPMGSMGDAVLADVQQMPESSFGTSNEVNTRMHATEACQQYVVLAEMQGMPDPFTDEKGGLCMGSHNLLDVGNNRKGKLTESPRGRERLDNKEKEDSTMREDTTMTGSFREVTAGFGLAEIHETSDSTLDEINNDSAGKRVTEDTPQYLFLVEISASESSSDKRKENSDGRIGTITSRSDAVLLDMQGMAQSAFEISNADGTGMHAAKAYHDDAIMEEMQGVQDPFLNVKEGMGGSNHNWMEPGNKRNGEMNELTSVERLDYEGRECATMVGSSHHVGAGFGLAEMQVMSDSLVDENSRDNAGEHTTKALQGKEMQGIVHLSLDEGSENVIGKHVTVTSDKDAAMDMPGVAGSLSDAVEKNAGEHSTEASQGDTALAEMQEVKDSSLREDNVGGDFIGASQDKVSLSHIQGMSNLLLYEGSQANAQKPAVGASQEDVVEVERQEISDLVLNEINDDNAQKRAVEREQGNLGIDYEHSVSISSALLGNPLENLVGVLTKENPLLRDLNAGKHAAETSQENDLGEQRMLGPDYEQPADNSLGLLENCLDNAADVFTKEKFQMGIQGDALEQNSRLLKELDEELADSRKGSECELEYFASQEKSLAGSEEFASRDVEVRQNIKDYPRNGPISTDTWARDSEATSGQIPTDMQFRDSEVASTSSGHGQGISSSLPSPQVAKTPQIMSSTDGEKSVTSMERAEMISMDNGVCHAGTNEIIVSEAQEAKDSSQLHVSVRIASVNNILPVENMIEVDEAAVNCEHGGPFSAIPKHTGDEDIDLPQDQKPPLHQKHLPLVGDSCVAGSSDSTTEMISMDNVLCCLETNETTASEVQETRNVSRLQVDVPTASVSVGITLVNVTSKDENMTEAGEATMSHKHGDPLSAMKKHKGDEDVDLYPKQTTILHRKQLSLVASNSDSTAYGPQKEAGQTSQFSLDTGTLVGMRSKHSMHYLSAETQITRALVVEPDSAMYVQGQNVSSQTQTERFDNSVVTSSTGSGAEKSLEIRSISTPTEYAPVKIFSKHEPASPAKGSICLIEAGQVLVNEEKDVNSKCLLKPKNVGSMVEVGTSLHNDLNSEIKFENASRGSMILVSYAGQEIAKLGAGATPVQEPNDVASSTEKALTDRCCQEMQIASPIIEIEDDHSRQTGITNRESEKCVKAVHKLFEATEQDGGHTNVDLPSNGHECLTTLDSGDTSMQNGQNTCHLQGLEGTDVNKEEEMGQDAPDMTLEVPCKDREEAEKDECEIENSDVSIEISFQTENNSPTIVGDERASQLVVVLNGDKKCTEQCDLGPLVESSFRSEEGEIKAELEAAIQTTSESDDNLTCAALTGKVLSQESENVSTDFPVSAWQKSSQSSQPMVSQNTTSTVHESRFTQHQSLHLSNMFQDEAENEETRKYVVSNDCLGFQEGNSRQTECKAKCIPLEEKGSLVNTVMELGKELSSFNQNSDERPIMSLCTATEVKIPPVSSGNDSTSIDLSSGASLTDIGTKCNLTTSVQTMTLPDLNTSVHQVPALFRQPFSDSQQVQLRAQILTYGSLIQRSLPEESLMMAAFGDSVSCDGNVSPNCGGSLWRKSWHLAAAKIRGKVLCQTSEMTTPMISSPSVTTHSMPSVAGSKISNEVMRPPSSPITVNASDSSNSAIIGMRSVGLAATKTHSTQTRLVGSPNIGMVGKKNSPVAMMSLPYPGSSPSPVWAMSNPVHEGIQGSNTARNSHPDSHQVTPGRHLSQTPHLGNYASASTIPWISNSPSPLPWITPRATAEPGLPFSTFMVPEVNQETLNNRNSVSPSVAYKSGTPLASPVTSTMRGSATVHVATNAKTDASKSGMGVGRQSSTEQKSRKRKKSMMSEEINRTGGLSQSGLTTSATGVFASLAASSALSSSGSLLFTPANHAGGMPSSLLPTGSCMPYDPSVSPYQVISRGEGKHTVIFSEETASCIEQAKLYAEEAASVAATAVRHSEAIWSQLGVHECSGLSSDYEAKLASSAVAAAAAASVAKAAAAAAKLAYEAALQAKLMAAEALTNDSVRNANCFGEAGYLQGGRQGQAIPNHGLIIKGRERESASSWKTSNSCHSKVAAAREVIKKRVEAVSAAAKRAQNLDAIERAAGLAAEAVSQAGAVVAMGDPVPLMLNTLLKAGPDGYWRLVHQMARTPDGLDNVQNEVQPPQKDATGNQEISLKVLEAKENMEMCQKEMPRKSKDCRKSPTKDSSQRGEIYTQKSDDLHGNIIPITKGSNARKDNIVDDAVQTSLPVLEVEGPPAEKDVVLDVKLDTKVQEEEFVPKTNEIKDGSLVEVVSDEEGLRGVWFSAKVLSLKDGKALVRYDELLSDEGSVQLQEWIPLEEESGKAPRIRMAHPMTVIKFEGTRKRRRAAMGNHVWSVGDHADAWIRDGWWEGIVVGKSEEDENRVTVYFPGGGDTSIIKAWNLRPSLVWKDGQWVEWTSSEVEKEVAHEDELPSGKRQKADKDDMGREEKVRDKLQKIPNVEEGKKVHELSAVISSVKGLKSSAGCAMNNKVYRSGLQNECSRVAFGVPKPAKKRKFMDVSRHYAADTIRKSAEGKATGKINKSKAWVSHSQSSWKTNKIEDRKPKKAMNLRAKELKLGKEAQDGQNKGQAEKGKNSIANPTTIKKDIPGHNLVLSGTPSINIDGSKTGRKMVMGGDSSVSACNEIVAHRPSPFNKALLVGETQLGSKGKQSCSSNISQSAEKNAKEGDPGKTTESIEPRRSNRRIQPTSRLLEGLQSSPKIVKSSLSSFSHEKGGKVQSKSSSLIPKAPVSARNVLRS